VQERQVDIIPSLIADRQPAVLAEPGQRPLDHPAVPPEPLRRLNALAGDPGGDPPATEIPATAGDVVGLVGMQLGWSTARPSGATARTEHRRNIVNQRLEQ
jgi:hypothetical protein